MTINERVTRGAAALDKANPGWERRVDLSKLDLQDSCRCVLGQLYGHYFDGLMALENGSVPIDMAVTPGANLGFNARSGEPPSAYRALDEAWISFIKERFDTGALSDA